MDDLGYNTTFVLYSSTRPYTYTLPWPPGTWTSQALRLGEVSMENGDGVATKELKSQENSGNISNNPRDKGLKNVEDV